jgi:parvulin-like peptidyl-prolyl isomerase
LNDIIAFYGRRISSLTPKLSNVSTFTSEVKNGSLQDLIIMDAEKIGVADEPEIRSQITEIENNKLSGLAEKIEVTEKAEVTDEDLQNYYAEHSAEFVRPAEMEIWEIFVKDENLAKKVLKKAKAGANFENLASKYSEDSYYKKKKGFIGYKQAKQRGAVSKEAFAMGPNKIGGPIKYRTGWAVIKTGNLKEQSLSSYEEVKGRVKNKVKSEKVKELRAGWEEALRDKYSVKINKELVEKI